LHVSKHRRRIDYKIKTREKKKSILTENPVGPVVVRIGHIAQPGDRGGRVEFEHAVVLVHRVFGFREPAKSESKSIDGKFGHDENEINYIRARARTNENERPHANERTY